MANYYDYYGKLVGKKVTRVIREEEIYGLVFDDETVTWILQDPEGNGPGHLEIQEPKKK
jgi:hypothetical protein